MRTAGCGTLRESCAAKSNSYRTGVIILQLEPVSSDHAYMHPQRLFREQSNDCI
jgi:hypothetical protein